MKKIWIALGLVLALLLLAAPTLAARPYDDVTGQEWYAEAVDALREKEIMSGFGGNLFVADGTFTRAQLAMVLYSMAGRPAVTGEDAFTDTESGQWYSDAILWASREGIVSGYGGGLYGTDDPVTQEQLAVMLWHDAGSYVVDSAEETGASAWAVDAVRWYLADDLHDPRGGDFSPTAPANRGQVADAVYRYLRLKERFADAVSGATGQSEQPQPAPEPTAESRALVVCFSCTGGTMGVAEHIAETLGAPLFRITPETPYTSADLNYGNSASRTTKEQNDPAARPAITGLPEDLDRYEVVFLGYPIWWGQAPKVMYTFVESCDLDGKTVVPFCTSGSSPIGSSAANLSKSAPAARWLDGRRFAAGAGREAVRSWLEGLGLDLTPTGTDSLTLSVNGQVLNVQWEENDAVAALRAMAPVTVAASPYGGFEQVGSLGAALPRSDESITTEPGDIVLYAGDQLVLFYGSNTWSYTRLGRITGLSDQQLEQLLGGGGVTVTVTR